MSEKRELIVGLLISGGFIAAMVLIAVVNGVGGCQ